MPAKTTQADSRKNGKDMPKGKSLTQTQIADQFFVNVGLGLFEIVQKAAAITDQHQKAAA